jgi:hypothetical protein
VRAINRLKNYLNKLPDYHIVNEILLITFISLPIIEEIKFNDDVGYPASGHRANAATGRTVLMCMIKKSWHRMDVYSSPGEPGQAAYTN